MADLDITTGEGVRVRVEGLAATMRALSAAGAAAEDMQALMHNIGMLMVRAASPPVLTGRLAGSVRAGRARNRAVVRAGGARVPYAPPIHYGWRARNIRPQPFLLEALNRSRGDVFNALDAGLDDLLRRADLK